MPRTSGAELPSEEEILEILAKESQRVAVRYDYMATYSGIFDDYKRLANVIGVDTGWIDDFGKLSFGEVKRCADGATAMMAQYILDNPGDYNRLYDALCVNDVPKKAEAIFVFGALTNARVYTAIELYHRHLADTIILSGKAPAYSTNPAVCEAERMAAYAIEHGVPESALVLEKNSITLPDNVKRTIDSLQEQQWLPASIIALSSSFVQRRAQMEWYKFTPWKISVQHVSPHENELAPHMRREIWHQSSQGVHALLNEYNKIIVEQRIDILRQEA